MDDIEVSKPIGIGVTASRGESVGRRSVRCRFCGVRKVRPS